jgi:zinc transporter ZupT
MPSLIVIIAALAGMSLLCLFGVVGLAAYSAAQSPCRDGNDCYDAKFAMVFAGLMVTIGVLLAIPLCRTIWRALRRS